MSEKTNGAAAPALGISVQCTIGTSQLVFQTHVAQDTTKEDLDALADRVTAVADRQKAKVDLIDLKKHLKVNEDQLRRQREDRQQIEERLTAPQDGRRNAMRNEADLKNKREQADVMDRRMTEIIQGIRDDIAAAEAVVGK